MTEPYLIKPLHLANIKAPTCAGAFILARAEGFEPPNASTKNWCLTTWRRPIAH